jgi:hypothetical protein
MRECTSYNLDVKSGIIHHKQRDGHMIDIACALQIPEMTIHTILRVNKKLKQMLKHFLLLLALQSTVKRGLFHACSPLVLILCLLSPISNAHYL